MITAYLSSSLTSACLRVKSQKTLGSLGGTCVHESRKGKSCEKATQHRSPGHHVYTSYFRVTTVAYLTRAVLREVLQVLQASTPTLSSKFRIVFSKRKAVHWP